MARARWTIPFLCLVLGGMFGMGFAAGALAWAAGDKDAAVAAASSEPTLRLSDHGKEIRALTRAKLLAIAPAETIRIHEPHEDAAIEFRGVPLKRFLDQAYGPAWRKAEEVLFICADGYRDPIPVSRIAAHSAWLAFERVGSAAFRLTEKEPKRREIELGPWFLAWDTLKDPEMRALGKKGWPYQVVGIDLIEFADRFPKLSPPASASASAKRGYAVFKARCVSCHALSGEGGKVGPELNAPVSVTTYFKDEWLKRWIANPSAVRAGTTMPAVIPAGAGQGAEVDDVVAYLKAMAP